MKRKFVALGMSVMMAAGCLAGCGGSTNNREKEAAENKSGEIGRAHV